MVVDKILISFNSYVIHSSLNFYNPPKFVAIFDIIVELHE
jgi:hypothetical protein